LGEGVPQAPRAAARWYEHAAEQGNPHAQLYLGAAYVTGSGVPKDRILACKWIHLAAPQLTGGDRQAAQQLLDRVIWDMTPAQVAAAVRLSQAWLEDHPESSGLAKGARSFHGDR
jgi:TPR repeat protein